MNDLDLSSVCTFVNETIEVFHQNRLSSLEGLRLNKLLKKNPYLFRAKNIQTASELITGLMDAFLSSSEEKMFGDFLEDLAVFIAGQTCGGHKSAAQGVDLEFIHSDTHYVVSIKSGPSWGNSSQHKKLAQDLADAAIRIRQSRTAFKVETVLGICYGKTRTTIHKDGYLKVVGQNFWYLISENIHLYTDIIEPIGYRAKEHNDAFTSQRACIVNKLTGQLIDRFCLPDGQINWDALVEFNSGNYDLDRFLD